MSTLRLPEHEVLPFAPGASPFRLKGTGYRGHMRHTEKHVAGGTRAMLDAFVDPRLRAWFEQPFLASTWYDVLPLVSAGHVCARLLGMGFSPYIQARTLAQVEEDLRGVYSAMMKLVSTEAVALRLPKMLATYFDFSKIETRVVRPGLIECQTSALPRVLAEWYTLVLSTYVRGALEMAQAKDVVVRTSPSEPDGAVSGAATVRFRWSVEWTAL